MIALKWFSSTVAVAILLLGADAMANTCAGACGGQSAGGCWCDDQCFGEGDCCTDVCTQCPGTVGCGGNGGGCGSVTFEGCCSGQTLQFCENGALQTYDCTEGPSCGWSAEGNFYDCETPGGADPSGMHPMNCTGGTEPVCGNGSCENGESSQNCPQDCSGGNEPVCGNGACENGETATSCPQDCAQGCGDKECGQDAQGNSCGSCPEDFFCTWDGNCESDTPCEPDCGTKKCGDDGCGNECGTCPVALVCSEDGVCISPPDINPPDDDVACTPDCTNRFCGDDGCGGSCGICPDGYGCTDLGLCQEGYIPPEPDALTDGENPYACPEGETLLYGKCVASGAEGNDDSGCSAGRGAPLVTGWLLFAFVAGLLVLRRRFA